MSRQPLAAADAGLDTAPARQRLRPPAETLAAPDAANDLAGGNEHSDPGRVLVLGGEGVLAEGEAGNQGPYKPHVGLGGVPRCPKEHLGGGERQRRSAAEPWPCGLEMMRRTHAWTMHTYTETQTWEGGGLKMLFHS